MKDESQLGHRADELLAGLRRCDAVALAARTGAIYQQTGPNQSRLDLSLWRTAVSVTLPGGDVTPSLDTLSRALLAYYLHQADGTPLAGSWIAFTELPDGRFYTAAFQGYTGRELARVFGNDLHTFAETAVICGGISHPFADRAFLFPVLPFVTVLVACWQGDEDFPPSYRILFDAHTSHHLPTDACAIVGSLLTRKLINAYNNKQNQL